MRITVVDDVTRTELLSGSTEHPTGLRERVVTLSVDDEGAILVRALAEGLGDPNRRPKPSRTYYRSVTEDGHTWCESRDPHEVRARSVHGLAAPGIARFERFDVYEVGLGWRRWVLP